MTVSYLPARTRKWKTRPIRVEGDVSYVPLSRGMEAKIDSVDVPLLDGRNWFLLTGRGGLVCAATKVTLGPGEFNTALMHRVIMSAPDEVAVDHIDGDRLDNRRSNLRLATNQQNCWNQGLGSRNTSGFKGVSWHSRSRLFQSSIRVGGRQITLGGFAYSISAARAYDKAAKEHYGEFARINFPNG